MPQRINFSVGGQVHRPHSSTFHIPNRLANMAQKYSIYKKKKMYDRTILSDIHLYYRFHIQLYINFKYFIINLKNLSIMKKLIFIASMVILCNLSDAQINMNSSGYVGIGGSPSGSNRLYVNGSTYLNSYVGIGINPSSSYKLYVNGNTYLSSYVGIGVAPSNSYKLHVSNGDTYLNSNVGIGVTPSSSYKLNVEGDSKIKGQLYI